MMTAWALNNISIQKADGPNGIPGHLLRKRADQLASVLTDISNTSLNHFPLVFQDSHHHTRKSTVISLNDYCTIALTHIMMVWLIKQHMVSQLPSVFDSGQFAYHLNCFTEDISSPSLSVFTIWKRGTPLCGYCL